MCKKTVRTLARECPTCQADLGILVDYLGDLGLTLEKALDKTRAGQLGEAVWAYLEVLEVEPDNPTARKQVAQVVTAVRQFDELTPGRRWADKLRRQAYWRGWKEDLRELRPRGWLTIAAAGLILVVTLLVGYGWGFAVGQATPPVSPPLQGGGRQGGCAQHGAGQESSGHPARPVHGQGQVHLPQRGPTSGEITPLLLGRMSESSHLLIFGASTRAAAFSALRAGFQPWCADLFADADLQARCPVIRVPASAYPRCFLDLARVELEGPWMYTGGLENAPVLIEELTAERELWGNVELLTEVRDPRRLARSLARQGIAAPRAWRSFRRGPQAGRWLSKPLRGAGGTGIRFWKPGTRVPGRDQRYLQEFIEGEPCSAVFLGKGPAAHLLGATAQLVGQSWLHAAPFHYCGSIGPLDLDASLAPALERLGDALARGYGLRGLFGVDCIIRERLPYPVEVNPRYTASVEVIEYATGIAALASYRQIFNFTDLARPTSPARIKARTVAEPGGRQRPGAAKVGKAILFARQALTFPAAGPWLQSLRMGADPSKLPAFADIPQAGEAIRAGKPVLTFFARGKTIDECRHLLQKTAAELDDYLFR